MRVVYNGIELLLNRTSTFTIEAKMDGSGLDMLYQIVTISTSFVFNPAATASNKVGGPAIGLASLGVRGDRLGPTLQNLRQSLSSPRGNLLVYIGNDLVFSVPGQAPGGGASYPCDPMGGPFPKFELVEVMGDKSAICRFTVQFAITDCQKIVLSHRWNTTCVTDEAGFTTKTTEGHATVNLALMAVAPAGSPQPSYIVDQFRAAITHPIPSAFYRSNVRVFVSERGDELSYTFTDTERNYNLGYRSPVARVTGNSTAGVTCPYQTIKGAVGGVGATFWSAISSPFAAMSGGGSPGAMLDPLTTAWSKMVPDVQARAITRCVGLAGAPTQLLSQIAINVNLDRLTNVLTGLGHVTSAWATVGHDSDGAPWAESRMSGVALNPGGLAVLAGSAGASSLLNFNPTIVGGDAAGRLSGTLGAYAMRPDVTYGNPFPASSDGTGGRARWIAEIVTQALQSGCEAPQDPEDRYYDPSAHPPDQATTI